MALLDDGDSFGAMMVPRVSARRAQALEETVYLMVPRDIIRRISSANGAFALALLPEAEVQRLKTEEMAVRLAFEPVAQRLARLLLDASNEETGELFFPLSQTEIANFIGRRETVCSLPNKFRRDDLVAIRQGKVHGRDREKLSSFA